MAHSISWCGLHSKEGLGDHLSPDEIGTFVGKYVSGSSNAPCFVALIDGALVGYAVAAISGSRLSGVDRLYVRKSENARAVAVALLVAVQESSKEPSWKANPLEIYDGWGFVDLPALRSCLARPWNSGPLTRQASAAFLEQFSYRRWLRVAFVAVSALTTSILCLVGLRG